MLDAEEDLEAVIIASATAVHAEQAIKAIERGLHVLCEKAFEYTYRPLPSRRHRLPPIPPHQPQPESHVRLLPPLRCLVPRCRRQDRRRAPSAFPAVFRSQTCDKLDPTGFFVEYAQVLWRDLRRLLHPRHRSRALVLRRRVAGQVRLCRGYHSRVSPQLRKYNDRDNATGIVEFHNGKIAQLFCSRMMAAGQEDCTEITGPSGKLAINCNPAENMLIDSRWHGD